MNFLHSMNSRGPWPLPGGPYGQIVPSEYWLGHDAQAPLEVMLAHSSIRPLVGDIRRDHLSAKCERSLDRRTEPDH